MRSDRFSQMQLDALATRVRPMLDYMLRLEQRMDAIGMLNDDRLRVAVGEAREKLQAVCRELTHLSCDGKFGLPDAKPRKHQRRPSR